MKKFPCKLKLNFFTGFVFALFLQSYIGIFDTEKPRLHDSMLYASTMQFQLMFRQKKKDFASTRHDNNEINENNSLAQVLHR